jgi:hypothetical protein
METIHNVASATSRVIWGDSNANGSQADESGREPVSGEAGNTANGEPYDAGNLGSKSSYLIFYRPCLVP